MLLLSIFFLPDTIPLIVCDVAEFTWKNIEELNGEFKGSLFLL
ncbi:signal transduction histidine kinase [Methanosarcina mazei Tuc01]|jgi:hypothetical protein|uniref:Signal transduction histidine kinase n=1 Tax=Methanosarcina mazei Tuc01 TaxID=1236903 RepID=M1PW93_METMZ|nr:signal transduction histidine kinase [Methanosarcina mazei Tuc01]